MSIQEILPLKTIQDFGGIAYITTTAMENIKDEYFYNMRMSDGTELDGICNYNELVNFLRYVND